MIDRDSPVTEDELHAYIDGELPERERAIFERHLELCKVCKDYLDSYKTSVSLAKQSTASADNLQSVEPVPVPEDLVRAILASRAKAK
jgi:anti-sigma factor RsiW